MPTQQTIWRILLFLLLAAVAFLSLASLPPSAIPGNKLTRMIASALFGDVSTADKVGHFIAYFMLGAAAFAARVARRSLWLAPLLITLYGVALEGAQFFLTYRTSDIADAIVNGVAATSGFAVAAVLKKLVVEKI